MYLLQCIYSPKLFTQILHCIKLGIQCTIWAICWPISRRTTHFRVGPNFRFIGRRLPCSVQRRARINCSRPVVGRSDWISDMLEILVGHRQALAQLKQSHESIPQVSAFFSLPLCEVTNRASESAMASRRIMWTESMEARLIELWQQRTGVFDVSSSSCHDRCEWEKRWQEISLTTVNSQNSPLMFYILKLIQSTVLGRGYTHSFYISFVYFPHFGILTA